MTEEEHKMIARVHDYLFHPPVEGKTSRAEQLDEVLVAVRAGKLGTRALLWLSSLVVAAGAVWAALSGWFK